MKCPFRFWDNSEPQPKLFAQMPLDTSVTSHDACDVSADALVEHWLSGHQAEAKPVFDQGVAPAGNIGGADERALTD
jgi:hypothetical protein